MFYIKYVSYTSACIVYCKAIFFCCCTADIEDFTRKASYPEDRNSNEMYPFLIYPP